MTDVVWVLSKTSNLCVILMFLPDLIAFPSGEDGDKLPSAEEDEESVSAHHIRHFVTPSPQGEGNGLAKI